MRIFISYSRADGAIGEEIAARLGAAGHAVFFDRQSLEAGGDFDRRIRDEIDRCHVFIFLISSTSIEPGQYTLTELGFAKTRWPNPSGVVLPVIVRPIPFEKIPPYLRSVTLLQPTGNLPAEVAATVAALARRRRRRRAWLAGVLIALLAATAGTAGIFAIHHANQHKTEAGSQSPPDNGNGDELSLGRGVTALPEAIRHRIRAATCAGGKFLILLADPAQLAVLPPSGMPQHSVSLTGEPVSLAEAHGFGRGEALICLASPGAVGAVRIAPNGDMSIEPHEVPQFVLDSSGKIVSTATPPEGGRRLSTVPGSVANSGSDIWLVTRTDGSAEAGLLVLHSDNTWHVPAYQLDFELGSALNGVNLYGFGRGAAACLMRRSCRLQGMIRPMLPSAAWYERSTALVECEADTYVAVDASRRKEHTG